MTPDLRPKTNRQKKLCCDASWWKPASEICVINPAQGKEVSPATIPHELTEDGPTDNFTPSLARSIGKIKNRAHFCAQHHPTSPLALKN